jgi:hypothetical protein
MAVDGAGGLAFRFFEGGTPGIEVGNVDVFEVENGAHGRTLCRMSPGSKLVEWVYGSDVVGGRYWEGPCPKLEANRHYGLTAIRPDRRVVVTRFQIDDGGHVHDYGRHP